MKSEAKSQMDRLAALKDPADRSLWAGRAVLRPESGPFCDRMARTEVQVRSAGTIEVEVEMMERFLESA
jgi:hypothetical protein